MSFSFDVAGDQQVNRTLSRFNRRVQDASPAFDEMADNLAVWNRRQFDTEGRSGSGGWRKLARKTLQAKRRKGITPRILVASGRLRDDLTRRPFGVERIGRQEMTVGTDRKYARFHQRGTATMPKRPPMELTEANRRQLTKILQKYLVAQAGAR